MEVMEAKIVIGGEIVVDGSDGGEIIVDKGDWRRNCC